MNASTRTETRGDTINGVNPARTFTYTGNLLTSATDFNGYAARQTYDANNYINSVTDRDGHITKYTHEALTGRLTQIQFPATPEDAPGSGGTINYTYGSASCADAANRDPNNPYYVCTATDEAGHTTQYYRYSAPGVANDKAIKQINYPDGESESFGYNSFTEIVSHQLTTGGVETYGYYLTSNGDPAYKNGLVKQYSDPYHASGNPSARYDYDGLSRLITMTDALGNGLGDLNHTTSYAYDSRSHVQTTTLPNDPNDGKRYTIVHNYNPNGTLQNVLDQLGHTTSYIYDDYKRVISITTPVRGNGDNSTNTTSFDYTRPGTSSPYWHTANFAFAITKPAGEAINNDCDGNFRRTRLTEQNIIGDSGTASVTTYGYDAAGNLTSVLAPNQQPKGSASVTAYDERNRVWKVTDPLSHTTVVQYDAYNRKASVTRPNGQVITYDSYDKMNRLLQQTATQSPEPNAVTKYSYDPTGGLLQTITDPNGNSYNYGYDLLNRKTVLQYPDASTEAWIYDNTGNGTPAGNGLLYQFKNRAGNFDTFTYDNLNRLTQSSWNDGVTPSVSQGYDAANRPTAINNSNSQISRAYYNDNTLWTETSTYGDGIARTVTYSYDPDGRRATLTYPNSAYTFSYTYTGRSELQTVVNSGATIANYGYDLNGNLTSRSIQDNSTSSSYGYDALNRCLNISHNLNGTTRTFAYHYDGNTVGDLDWGQRDGASGDVYNYDQSDQATTAQLNIASPTTTAPGTPNIIYDANGNRTSFNVGGANQSYSAVNNLNQYTTRTSGGTTTSAVYDANGNMITGLDGSSFTYDAQNRLIKAVKSGTTDTFLYDGLNRQIGKTITGQALYYRVYDGWDLLGEYKTGTSGAFWAYLYGAGGMVKNLVTNNYYYQDASGSTSHLANSAGALIEWYRYDLQGTPYFYNASNQPRSSSNYYIRHLFTGQQWYSELGLYDLRNRYYSPDIGRFLQGDPIGFWGDRGNLYRYCGNNPLRGRDPFGLDIINEGGQQIHPAESGPDSYTLDGQNQTDYENASQNYTGPPPDGPVAQGPTTVVGSGPPDDNTSGQPGGQPGGEPGGTGTVPGGWGSGGNPSDTEGPSYGYRGAHHGPARPTGPSSPSSRAPRTGGPSGPGSYWAPFWRFLETPATPAEAAYTHKGLVPTLILTIPVAAPFVAPETGLFALLASLGDATVTGLQTAFSAARVSTAAQFINITVQTAELTEATTPMAETVEFSLTEEAPSASEYLIESAGETGGPPGP